MMSNNHIISRGNIEFAFNTIERNYIDSKKIVDWSKSYLLPLIEDQANKYGDPNHMVCLDQLNIELDISINGDFFKPDDALISQIRKQLAEIMKESIRAGAGRIVMRSSYDTDLIISFLKTGHLNRPVKEETWGRMVDNFTNTLFGHELYKQKVADLVITEDAFMRLFELLPVERFIEFIMQGKNVLQNKFHPLVLWKIIQQYPTHFRYAPLPRFLYHFFKLFGNKKMDIPSGVAKLIKEYSADKQSFNNIIVSAPEFQNILGNLEISTNDFMNQFHNAVVKEQEVMIPETSDELKEGINVLYAGLVLLAPFLTTFLKDIGRIDQQGDLIDKDQLPILLHYIISGETKALEWELAVPKILSGLPLNQHCAVSMKADEELDQKIQILLQSVISNWKALKNSSNDALRETFLCRPGQLIMKNGCCYLSIEERTVDILLSFIPWNYSTIKFNWMNTIVFVKWNKS